MNRSIAFVLPEFHSWPSGGYKVVYEYASRLSERGHQVSVVHPRTCREESLARQWLGAGRRKVEKALARRDMTWFPLPDAVAQVDVDRPGPEVLGRFDTVVATAWETAPWVARASVENPLYLIQHHETWNGPAHEVDATWRLPLRKIVIARWLEKLAEELDPEGIPPVYIPNGIDFGHLGVHADPRRRSDDEVLMLHHGAEWKGTAYGIAALGAARDARPSLRATLFGVAERPGDLPLWIEYIRQPDRDQLLGLYNRAAVFLHPSLAEGWPLPPAEAMACGAVVVAAANPGVSDYVRDGVTGRLVPMRDSTALADALLSVLSDSVTRVRLANNAQSEIKRYTWERAVDAFEGVVIHAPAGIGQTR